MRFRRFIRFAAVCGVPFANAETSAWVARVVAAGSTVSSASATAHDAFITAAKAGGFWSLISRLNTYGANTLAGAMVPLVNTVGGTTDTNHNFVSADFSLASGLVGDGATKYLDSGALLSSFVSTTTGASHMGVVNLTGSAQNNVDIGIRGAALTVDWDLITQYGNGNAYVNCFSSGGDLSYSSAVGTGFHIASRTTATAIALYRNGVSKASGAGSTSFPVTLPTQSVWVFLSNPGTGFVPSANRCGGYTIGTGLTSTQVTAYYTALNALMAALGRTIPA